MHDRPGPDLLIAEVARALAEGALGTGFPQKVAANALGIALRELKLGAAHVTQERGRLAALVEGDGDLAAANRQLALAIREGRVDVADPMLLDHLIRTTIAKLEVDQPGYPAFKIWKSAGAQ